jgi:hypothetical protein
MSVEGCEKVATLPSRKFAKACWKLEVPVGWPVAAKVKEPWPLAAFSVLL